MSMNVQLEGKKATNISGKDRQKYELTDLNVAV